MRVLRWILMACALVAMSRAAEPSFEQGEIQGAKYNLLRPKRWNRGILLLAHDYRPESSRLVADFGSRNAGYQKLVEEGWIVAKTSYRRNGTIVTDALADLDNLRAEIVRRFGAPEKVLVEGDGMGGTIALAIAERPIADTPLYQGVIAVDPAFNVREPNGIFSGVDMQPKIPVILLCNRNDFEGSKRYTQLNLPGAVRPFVPALLKINRDGHVNVNQAERLTALRTLTSWIDGGQNALPLPNSNDTFLDITKIPEAVPSRVFFDEDRHGFTAHVEEISDVSGSLLLDAQAEDFATIGLGANGHFQISIHEKTYRVLFGKDFSNGKHGQWIAFLNADGFFWLGRNHASAAEKTGAQLGELVHVHRYDDASASQAEGSETQKPEGD